TARSRGTAFRRISSSASPRRTTCASCRATTTTRIRAPLPDRSAPSRTTGATRRETSRRVGQAVEHGERGERDGVADRGGDEDGGEAGEDRHEDGEDRAEHAHAAVDRPHPGHAVLAMRRHDADAGREGHAHQEPERYDEEHGERPPNPERLP